MTLNSIQAYSKDIVAWANEQAQLLRSRRFDLLDVDHIADEIEEVGKREQRELANRIAKLLVLLLKRPDRQDSSLQRVINEQRKIIKKYLAKTPSLQPALTDEDWRSEIWSDAVVQAIGETGIADFPEVCPWLFQDQVLSDGWLPS